MEFKKFLTPWNWFKKEEEQGQKASTTLPVSRDYPLSRLHQDLDHLFDNFFRGFSLPSPQRGDETWMGGLMLPRVDIAEAKKEYTITVEVPGVDEKDIDLTITEGTLTIRGEKHYEKEDHDRQYHRVERSYGHFQRVISLPADANEDAIEAKFKNGILTLTIPKTSQAKPEGRKIPIS